MKNRRFNEFTFGQNLIGYSQHIDLLFELEPATNNMATCEEKRNTDLDENILPHEDRIELSLFQPSKYASSFSQLCVMDELKLWFNALPKFTKYWFGGTIATCLIGRFNLISPYQLILLYEPFINQFQIWRPITASLYYPLSPNAAFHFLMMMYFLVNYSRMLETGVFATRPADYATLLLFNWTVLVVTALILNLPLLLEPMVYAILYIWSQLYADQTVSFFFGFQFQAKFFPWVLFGFDVIFSHDYVGKLIAFLVGHMYVFLKFQYQEQYGGSSMLNTPAFLESWFPPTTSRSARTSEPEPQGGRSFGFGHSWGRGQTLGSN